MRSHLDARLSALGTGARRMLLERRGRAAQAAGRLNDLSPLKVLERGYALIFDEHGQVLKSADQTRPGENITARLARGTLAAKVTATKK